jgi:hypothetical protein
MPECVPKTSAKSKAKPIPDDADGMYRISIVSRGAECGPAIPSPPTLNGHSLIRFLLCKILNFYRTILYTTPFCNAVNMLRKK